MTDLTLPISIESFLDRFASRRRWQRVIRAAGIALILAIAWFMLCCLLDRWFGLPWIVRGMLLAINIAGVAAIVGRAVARLLRPRDLVRAAVSVERRTPAFAQRLETVASRAVGPQSFRGSAAMLDSLTHDVAAEVSRSDPAALLPWGPVLRPWAVAGIALGMLYLLSQASWLDLPRLARRYSMPWTNISEVTTTRLTVRPGNVGVAEGDTLRVHASFMRLGESSPLLHARSTVAGAKGQPWSQQIMSATAGGDFEARLHNVDRDIEYFVTGGDASSEIYIVRVWRRPAITRFRIRYVYPAYTALRPREAESGTGQIEAPIGTEVTIGIEASEPLGLAVMTMGGGEPVRFSSTDRANLVTATFIARQDSPYTIRMASVHGVSGAFRGGMIHALPDRKPVARFRIAPPREAGMAEVLPIAYQAIDDFGIARLELEVSAEHAGGGGAERRSFPIPIIGSRREHGQFPFDLKKLPAAVGDTLELRLLATDRAGQSNRSDPARVRVTAVAPLASTRPAVTQPSHRADNPSADTALDPPGFAEPLRAYFEAIRGTERE